MPVREPPVFNHRPHGRAEVQQAQGIRHRRAGLADALRCFLLRHAVLTHEHLIALRFLDRVQILALEVFNHRQLHRLAVVGFDDDSRHLAQPRHPRRAPAAFARDDLIVAGLELAHRQRLNDAVLADGVSQIGQRLRVKLLARLGRAALHLRDGEVEAALFLLRLNHIVAEQGGEPFSKALACICHGRSPFPYCQALRLRNSALRFM